jgi:hypothetical protein
MTTAAVEAAGPVTPEQSARAVSRRDLTETACGLGVLVLAFVAVRLYVAPYVVAGFFAAPAKAAPAGGAVWGNLIASGVCAVLIFWRLRARMIAHHAAQLAQSARHHRQQMAQAAAHHQETIELAEAHHADLRKHVAAEIAGQSEGISILSGATTAVLAAHVRGQEATV